MTVIQVSSFKSSLFNPAFDSVQTIEIETRPFAEGGFGKLHHCLKINGRPPLVPQVIKIFVDAGSEVHLQGFKTIQKLQEKMIALNHQRKQKNEPALDQVPLLFALPQFSYDGMMNQQRVLGYSANRIDAAQFIEFEEILNDVNLQRRYYPLSLEQKLGYALQLAEGVNLLRDMSFIHADINGQNLFISLRSGQLILIDYDSGAVTEDPNDSPTTWGKPNEWAAPEIVAQIGAAQRSGRTGGGQTVRVNLHTDTWSVAVGIHYLIFLRHPLFFLNCQGAGEMRAYFSDYQWPNVDHWFSNFNPSCAASHNQIKSLLTTHPQLAEITKRLAATINQGFEEPRQRTTYYQWYHTIKNIRPYTPPAVPLPVKEPVSKQTSDVKTFTNSQGMTFVLIPAGTFIMGSPESEPGRNDNETQHQVTLSRPFYMQTTEVTQAQWDALMGDLARWNPLVGDNPDNPSRFRGADLPVDSVSWDDIQKFIKKLNETDMTAKYRLPTEAEWEYACRAGSNTAYCFGYETARLGEYAWYDGNSGDQSHPVGQKKPNAWGLYDMHGNVWEWCQECYDVYPSGPVTDPAGPSYGDKRVLRGGCWYGAAGRCRAAIRSCAPAYNNYLNGFRLVCLQEPSPPKVMKANTGSAPALKIQAKAQPIIQPASVLQTRIQTNTNIFGMTFVQIPAGTFIMGSPESEPERRDDEVQHQVTLSKPFYMQTTEVTRAQWVRVMKGNRDTNLPVAGVSWNNIQEFIKMLNYKTDQRATYRLPTEAEWEYACRAGSNTAYCFGDETARLGEYAWYHSNSWYNNSNFEKTKHPVGQKKPNAWGLYDMHGNVYEWCQDWYGAYPSGPVTDQAGPSSGDYRVRRGGGWGNRIGDCRSAYRSRLPPDNWNPDVGFRLVLLPGH